MKEITTEGKTVKYIIWLHDLPTKEYSILINNLDPNLFEIVDDSVTSEKIKNIHYLEGPDLIICGKNDLTSFLTDEIRALNCGICKVEMQRENALDDSLLLNDDKIEYDRVINGKIVSNKQKNIEYALDQIIMMCQMSEFSKLQRFAHEESKKVIYEEIPELRGDGDIFSKIGKEISLKIAKRLNEFITMKDNYTAGHCDRVAKYAELLGKAINLKEEELFDLKLAAYLHDIGKIALPDAIITKTSKLNDVEYNIMKKHVELGAKILPNESLGYLNKIIRAHHERYDGKGYPDGLKGEEIPLFSQILAIADGFDAMTSQRSYNHVKSIAEACDDLKVHTLPVGILGGQGVMYNAELVDQFIYEISNNKEMVSELNKVKMEADLKEQEALKKKEEKEKIDKVYVYERKSINE